LVCRLCGAANLAHQASCSVCNSPLERQPEKRGSRKHAEPKTAGLIWIGLCLVVGAGLGLALVQSRAGEEFRPDQLLLGGIVGALCGVGLGVLPGMGARFSRRTWATLKYGLCHRVFQRRRARIQRRCEARIRDDPGDLEAQLRLAGAMWLEGERDRAEQVLRRLLDRPDCPSLARHNLAAIEAAIGRRMRALEELAGAAPLLGKSTASYWNLGLAQYAVGQFAEAAEAFRELMRLDPGQVVGRNALAVALAKQGEVEEAIAELESALRIDRRDPDVLCTLGTIQQSLADLTLAEQYFTAALRARPTHLASRYNRALCAMLEGRYHAAIADLSAATQIDGECARAFLQKAICWHRLGHPARAIGAVRTALRDQPADFEVRYNAGTLLLREHQTEHAAKELERAYALDPRDVDAIINLGVAVHTGELTHQALDHFRVATRINPRHALARYNSAVIYAMLDSLGEAEAELQVLLELYPDFPEAYNEIGVVYLRQDRLLEAAGQFRSVTDKMPRSAAARCNLALTYYLQGDFAASAEQARFATALDPKLAAAHEIAGRAAMELRDLVGAIEHFIALTKLEPSNPDAHSNLGLAYYRDDRLNEAIESYKRALIFSPHSPEGHNDLGLAYAKSKMLTEAVRHLRQVIDWRPDNPIAHSNLGLVHYFKGQSEEAVERWRDVTRLSPVYARKREATRFSAYDDQEMVVRRFDARRRASHHPLKIAAFRHSFQLALDENAYRMDLPWPDLAAAARWKERAQRARLAATKL
jgi:tetratricopeptide (TPR) repeat protein